MNDATVITTSKNQTFTVLDNETVIVNLAAGTYYSLDAIGTRVWDLIQKPSSIADIYAALVQEYQVEESQCRDDVYALLDTLAAEGLLEVH